MISERSVEAVIVDTTLMEKAIAHPTDARLYEKARRRLVALAQEADLSLRQSYARLAPRLSGQVGRYAHARQFKRMRKALRRLKGYTGRVVRDIQRQLGRVTDNSLRQRIKVEVALVDRLLRQKLKDKGKLYALHEPAVDCISKGKARVIAATVAGMPDNLGGKRMAIRIAELARDGLTPDWMPGAVPRCVPVEMKRNQHGERAATMVVGTARILSRGKWRSVEVLACPVTFSPHQELIDAARRAYGEWWLALEWVRELLLACGMLREVEVEVVMPKMQPWKNR